MEIEATIMEAAWVCTHAVIVLLGVFVVLLTVEVGVPLTLSPALGTLFVLFDCFVQP